MLCFYTAKTSIKMFLRSFNNTAQCSNTSENGTPKRTRNCSRRVSLLHPTAACQSPRQAESVL